MQRCFAESLEDSLVIVKMSQSKYLQRCARGIDDCNEGVSCKTSGPGFDACFTPDVNLLSGFREHFNGSPMMQLVVSLVSIM